MGVEVHARPAMNVATFRNRYIVNSEKQAFLPDRSPNRTIQFGGANHMTFVQLGILGSLRQLNCRKAGARYIDALRLNEMK